jgi:hypothetical protein
MQIDSTLRPDIARLGEFGIAPHLIEEILQDILSAVWKVVSRTHFAASEADHGAQ